MAAEASTAARRIAAVLSWASAAYLLTRVVLYYLHIGKTQRHHVESASLVFVVLLIAFALTRAGRDQAAGTTPPADRILTRLAWCLAFVVGAVLLYWPVIFTGLFADDFVLLTAAQAGRFTVWSELFRPSVFVVWRALSAVAGDPGVPLHAANVILHGINGFLVCTIGRAARLPRWAAACAGVLFVSYPAAVEAVAWPSGIQDVLMTTCVLTVVAIAVSWRSGSVGAALGIVALLAGLLTKETAIAAPLILAALGFVPELRRPAWAAAVACGAVVAVFLAVRFSLLPLPSSFSSLPDRYAIKELLVRPFATLIVPFRADETLRHPALGILSVALVVLTLRSAASRTGGRDRAPALAFASACTILAAVAPVLTYFYVDADLFGSRYLYLALSGWVLLLATSASVLTKIGAVPLACLIAVWLPSARAHMTPWQDAAMLRDRILTAAAGASDASCAGWIVSGVPATLRGVPLFVNGFPEAARPSLGEPILMAPAQNADGPCRLTWTGSSWKRTP